jgi:hypothetical protein
MELVLTEVGVLPPQPANLIDEPGVTFWCSHTLGTFRPACQCRRVASSIQKGSAKERPS